jgi:alpha-beta hydrolase superfamily lysophospholipase
MTLAEQAAKAGAEGASAGAVVNIFLVHGTFAQGAAWTDPQHSPLCKAIAQALAHRPLAFHALTWTGNNSHADRKSAGQALADALCEATQAAHAGPCFVVGHSHGGAVITHAIKDDPTLAAQLDGVVFLSTPFIHLTRRHFSKYLAWALGAILLILLLAGALVFTEWAMRTAGATAWVSRAMLVLAIVEAVLIFGYLTELPKEDSGKVHPGRAALFAPLVVLPPVLLGSGGAEYLMHSGWSEAWATRAGVVITALCAAVGIVIAGRWFPHAMQADIKMKGVQTPTRIGVAVDWLIEDFAVRHLRPEATLFVRTTGDEATAALGWVQAVSRLIGEVIARIVGVFTRYGGKVVWLVVVIVGAALMMATLSNLIALYSNARWSEFSSIWHNLVAYQDMQGTIFERVANQVWSVLKIVSIGSGLCLAIFALILTVFNRAFGRWFLWTALFLEVTVESVPPGKWQLLQLDTKDESASWDGVQASTLAHSQSYSDARAIAAVAEWISVRSQNSEGGGQRSEL